MRNENKGLFEKNRIIWSSVIGLLTMLIYSHVFAGELTEKTYYENPPSAVWSQNPECGLKNVNTGSKELLTKSMQWSLWTFRSEVWNGYVDFRPDGQYWTHWGYGQWEATDDGRILMINDYDPYRHEFVIRSNGESYGGTRSDGIAVAGVLVCGDYARVMNK
jgi:hypothetical protein